MQTFAIFETGRAKRYLSALCHHFGRKVEAKCAANTGWVRFPFGDCEMTADDKKLELRVTAHDKKHLDQAVKIVTSHLERFAFRENPTLNWQLQPNPNSQQQSAAHAQS